MLPVCKFSQITVKEFRHKCQQGVHNGLNFFVKVVCECILMNFDLALTLKNILKAQKWFIFQMRFLILDHNDAVAHFFFESPTAFQFVKGVI